MHLTFRRAIVIAAIVVFCGLLAGCQMGPTVPGPYDFAHADQLEKQGHYTEAVQVYQQIVHANQRTKPEVSADALYRLGVYTSDPNRYGKTPQLLTDGQNMAWATWKQLRDEYPEQAQKLLHLGQPDDKLEQIAATIDRRNSVDWKYQIIDSFV